MRKMTFIIGYWPRNGRCYFSGKRKAVFLLAAAFILGFAVYSGLWDRGKLSGIIDEAVYYSIGGPGEYVAEGGFSDSFLKTILKEGLPGLSLQQAQYISPGNLAESILTAVSTVNFSDPKELFESQFSYIEEIETEAEEAAALTIPYHDAETGETAGGQTHEPVSGENSQSGQDLEAGDQGGESPEGKKAENDQKGGIPGNGGDNPLVGIYNTHNAENYSPSGGDSKLEGKNAGVVRVAEVLETTLKEKYGIAVARSKQIHDYPDWNASYTRSKETAKSLLSKSPSIQILVDIHRDAGVKERRTVTVNGSIAAQILFIVGSSQRLEHPNWEKNKEFAEALHKKAEALYPGFSRGVRVQSGRYNQHLHPRAVLIEVGSVKNSLPEAEAAGKLLAHIISEVLQDVSQERL